MSDTKKWISNQWKVKRNYISNNVANGTNKHKSLIQETSYVQNSFNDKKKSCKWRKICTLV